MTRHGRACVDDACDYCQQRAEERAADLEPDYDLDGAANQYERQFGL